jgi:sec-independent protein translocase protein TatA
MGMTELILILAIVVLFFGASRLPGLGEALGKALRNLRGAAREAGEKEERGRRKELPPPRGGPGSSRDG